MAHKPSLIIALAQHPNKGAAPGGAAGEDMDDGGDKKEMAMSAMDDFIKAVKGGDSESAYDAWCDLMALHEPDGDEGGESGDEY